MRKHFVKRFLATVLSMSMTISLFPQSILAYDEEDEALFAELQGYSDEYPNGAFAFRNSQLEASEGDGSLYIDVVRMGDMTGEASVNFKAIDISAVYGKDYTLSVDEGFFITHELEQDPDAVPFMDLVEQTETEIAIGEKAERPSEDENVIEVAVSPEDGIVDVEGNVDEKNAASEQIDKNVDEEISEQSEKPQTGLRAAWSEATGKKSDRKNWQEINGTESAEAAELAEDVSASNGYIDEFAAGVPGTEYTLKFKDGEYLKRVKVELIDDDLSETDEQVMFVLADAQGADMAKPNTAYLNITDNDENEPVIFSLPDGDISVYPEDRYAYVNVERISGIEKFASVIVGTGAITAKPGEDYESGSVEVVFPQGVKTKTVKVPVYDKHRTEDVTFAVAIDSEQSYADPSTSSVGVTIVGTGTEEQSNSENTLSGDTYANNERSLMSQDEASDDRFELFGYNDSKEVNVKASSTSNDTGWGSWGNVLSNLDLRNATSITVDYKSEGSYNYTYQVTEGSGCNAKTVSKTGTRYGKEGKIKVGGKEITLSSNNSSATITGFGKGKSETLQLAARRTENGNNGTVSYTITKVTVAYEDISVTVDNSRYADVNCYTEKVYEAGGVNKDSSSGLTYENGNSILLGEGKVNNQVSYVAKKYSDALNFSLVNPASNSNEKTTKGIRPQDGVNVYLAGWQVYNSSKNMYDEDIIRPDAMNLETLYSKYGNITKFQIRPVIYPYASMVKFNNSYPTSLAYTNNISNGKEVKVTMLDTFNITGVGINNSGYAVKNFAVSGFYDSSLHGTSGSERSENSDAVKNYSADEIKKYLDNQKGTGKEVTKIVNEADSSKLIVMPNCDAIYIDMSYTQPKIEVQYNPAGSTMTEYADKGNVFYYDTNNPENSVTGNSETPMTIQSVMFGSLYNIQSAYSNIFYKTVWQDFTGDVDKDGKLTGAEQEPLLQYNLNRNAVTSDVFTYNPKVTNSLIYYYFTPRNKAKSAGVIDGVVLLRDYPIFGDKKVTETPINGVAVTVDGISVSTENNEDYGGIDGKGGDGYFSVEDKTFISGEAHRVNIVYGSLSTAASQNVNVSQKYTLDAYDVISVSNASKAKNDKVLQADELMYNDDNNYTLTFNTKSSNSNLVAEKAVLTFYRKDGTYITEKSYNSTGDKTGVFDCTFNPKTLGLPAGGKITVKFTDNNGVTYFEHDTGISLAQSLGAISLLTSFSGKAAPVLNVIGKVSSAFNFGWDGNLDDIEGKIGEYGNYSITTSNNKKVLNLGLQFSHSDDGDDDDDKKEDTDKKSDDGKKSKKDVKKAAEKSGNDEETKKEKKEAAESADSKENESKSELAVGYSVKLSFGVTLTLALSEDEQHKGEWYFEEFMIIANAAGDVNISKSFVTPIGIPVIVGAGIGASGHAIVVVERRLGSAEYYMADLTDNSYGSVDLVNKGQSASDYFYVYGDFEIAPYISVNAGVGVDSFNVKLHGKAGFDFLFNTKTKENSGDVEFSCMLSIKILFFEKEWTLGSEKLSLFSDGADLYESLDTFKVSDRAYLENRGEWNSGENMQQLEVANLHESEIMHRVNPNTDTKIAALDDGKYIAVFVNDDPARSAENSMAVFYTIYENGKWSEPKIIEDDGTSDDSPEVYDVGNGQLFIAWSTANQKFGENPNLLDVLNSRNIHGVFVDKSNGAMGDIIEVTKNTNKDTYADTKPRIAYDSTENKMIIYYTKSEYEATENESGVIGDAVYPYDVIAYRIYDMNKGDFVEFDANADGLFDYQILVDVAPTVVANETLTDEGYWTETPTFTKYKGENDPIIIESDAIAYNGLSLFAYTLDYDGNKETTNDRDVFMQIYDFKNDSITHPIMITSNNVEERSLQFERVGGGITFLSYISNGEIKMFDVSSNISNESVTKEAQTDEGVSYYYIEKTPDSGYIPERIAVKANGGGDYSGEMEIVDFNLHSGDDYFYVMFTEKATKLKEGVEANSEDASLAENNPVETQIYMTRYDIKNGVLTNPVEVTNKEGANYANVDFAVSDSDGGFLAMATKSMSTTEEIDGIKVSTDGSDDSSLDFITFTPDANVTIENEKIEGIVSGGLASGNFELYNGGIETINGLTLEVTDSNGDKIELPNDMSSGISLTGGEKKYVAFSLPVAEQANETSFTAVVKDSVGNEITKTEFKDSVQRNLDVVGFNADITERGVIDFNATLKNNGSVTSGERTFTVTAGDKQLYSVKIESLNAGEIKDISGQIKFNYDDLFTSVKNDDGSVSAETILTASAGNENLTDTLTLLATSEQMARMNAVTDIAFADSKNVSVGIGKYYNLDPSISAENYSGRYTDNNEDEISAQGVTLKFFSEDESVAKVYENGYIEGVNAGNTVVTALLMPTESTYDGTDYVSDYPTLPNDAIKSYSIDVNVKNSGGSSSGRGSSGGGTSSCAVKLNLGDGAVKNITVTKNSTIGDIESPVKDGYVFGGWYTDEALTVKADSTSKITESTTLYAKWDKANDEPNTSVWTNPFTDTKANDWFYDDIRYVYQKGLMDGIDDTLFAPNADLTRAMLVTILYRAEEKPAVTKKAGFTDVADNAYYVDAVAWAEENGVVMGISDTEFAPDIEITREQIATIMYRYALLKGAKSVSVENKLQFSDAGTISEYAVSAMNWVVDNGIIEGYDDNTIRLQNSATRAETAAILQRLFNFTETLKNGETEQ